MDTWDYNLSWSVQAVVRLVAAAAMGAIIGMEREYHGRSAGFRTQLLVALGSAMAMIVSLQFGQMDYKGWLASGVIQVDPARVAYGVMGGIGFLGAGAIIRYGGGVRGLTTAASLWCTAAVGLACGLGIYLVALLATGMIFFALFALARLDRLVPSHSSKRVSVRLKADPGSSSADRIRKYMEDNGATVWNIQYHLDFQAGIERITFYVTLQARAEDTRFCHIVARIPDVLEVSIL